MKIKENNSDIYYNGSRWKSNNCGEFEIVGVGENRKYKCRFDDGVVVLADTKSIRLGNVKNYNTPSCNGVGYIGYGDYSFKKDRKVHLVWSAMLGRCYGKRSKVEDYQYYNISVCEDWCSFQNFTKWFYENCPNGIGNVEFSLDKDLLQEGVENKIYSPETCVFLPKKINSFLTNNQPRHNTSGYTGVSINRYGTWRAQINDFETGKYTVIKWNCETKEEAYELYKDYRAKNAEKVKDYLRSLNYLPEEIIQLVK